jgi:hypothetical protein
MCEMGKSGTLLLWWVPVLRTVPARDNNCIYSGTFSFNFKHLYFLKLLHHSMFSCDIKLTYSSSYIERVSALLLILTIVFYTLKHVLSEMIETVPLYTIRNSDERQTSHV